MKSLRLILIIALLSSCTVTRNSEPFAPDKKHNHVSVSKGNKSFSREERTSKLKHTKHKSKLPLSYRIGLFINNLRQ